VLPEPPHPLFVGRMFVACAKKHIKKQNNPVRCGCSAPPCCSGSVNSLGPCQPHGLPLPKTTQHPHSNEHELGGNLIIFSGVWMLEFSLDFNNWSDKVTGILRSHSGTLIP
jgi:hypothetical protein